MHGRHRRLSMQEVRLSTAICVMAVIAVVVCVIALKLADQSAKHKEITGTQRAIAMDDEVVPVTQAPQSTPRDEWYQGSMPYLYQIDPQYKDVPYSGDTLETQGCGPTALSMVYIDLTGDTSLGPAEMAAFSTENGYSTNKNGSSWLLMSAGAEKLGLTSESMVTTPAALSAALQAGHPVICMMGPGAFTEVGHYIAIEGLDENGKAIVHDSNSRARSLWRWDLSTICAEAEAVWSFSAA